MLKVADGRSVQRVAAQPPLLGKSLSKVKDSRQRYQAYDKLLFSNEKRDLQACYLKGSLACCHQRVLHGQLFGGGAP